jgi:hypothetical protein
MSERPYSRLYHELSDEYPDVYDGPLLADYVRLLVAADQAYPSRARWAGYTTKRNLDQLADSGLVICDGARYAIRGMEGERKRRSDAARNAADARWGNAGRNAGGIAGGNAGGNADRIAGGNAGGVAPPMPSQAKPSQDETRQDEPSRAMALRGDALGYYYDLKGGQVSEGAVRFVSELEDEFGSPRVVWAMGVEAKAGPVDRTFLSRVKSRLVIDAEVRRRGDEEAARVSEAEYQRRERERIESMTPEDHERAAAAKAEVDAFVRGMSA